MVEVDDREQAALVQAAQHVDVAVEGGRMMTVDLSRASALVAQTRASLRNNFV